jgi:hypothetical protein
MLKQNKPGLGRHMLQILSHMSDLKRERDIRLLKKRKDIKIS